MAECTKEYFAKLATAGERCALARDSCSSDAILNYHVLHFCYLDEKMWLTFPLLVLLLIIKFKVVAHISDEYLAQALARISKFLELSEAVAGATLVSLCNSISDIFTVVLAALRGAEDNNDLAIGSLFGASLFTCTVVFGRTILASASQEIHHLDKGNAMFDLAFFIVGIGLFLLIGSFRTLMIWTGLVLFATYVLYIYFLVKRDQKQSAERKREAELLAANLGAQAGAMQAEAEEESLERDESVLEEDAHLFEKHTFSEVLLKLKKRVAVRWRVQEVAEKVFFFAELPLELLV